MQHSQRRSDLGAIVLAVLVRINAMTEVMILLAPLILLLLLLTLFAPPAVACILVQENVPVPAGSSTPMVSSEPVFVNEWPRFLGSQINGISRSTDPAIIIRKDWSENGLPLLWQADVGEGYGIGSVAGGRYYHFDKLKDAARLRSFDAKTGALIWEYKYPSSYRDLYGYDSGPRSSPLIDGDRVYLFGVEGKLICLKTDGGQPVWTVDTAKKFGVIQNFFGVSSNPVIYNDKIIVMVGGSPAESANVPRGQLDRVKSDNCAIVAFDKNTGEVEYKTGDDLASYSSLTWMGAGNNKTLVAWCRNALWGIDPENGRVKFKFPFRAKKLESVNAMTPVIDGSRFFLSECYELGSALVEVEKDQCRVRWSDRGRRKKSFAAHWGTPVLHEGHLYGSSGRHSSGADLRCVELETGDVKWVQRGFGRCSVLLIGDALVVVGERGRLALVEATPTAFRLVTERAATDTFALEPDCWAAPIVAQGRLYVRGGNKVGCFMLAK